ncbi:MULTISPECIES: SDR family NAD(P)-dependent oxidoreductase [unclassified Variovorax]|uniref:SDR family NAD(P)-dependent oxidoreductase n=1 Tax=unclassified Variovorax TaxID=663243 RepID=UPI0008389B91|nr:MULTISPECIES: SDR family NAD(P)-dependent oxidoreductase [unclassified Variovorax]PNG58579.1 Dihydroanticapsin 7-dehydrogenase [Variovorax sp. B4]PNG61631.1 Dihydroanticapsin 7-dehydrogenase [Variovorax sp. B2]VTV12329.1 3-oxoacyl-[acyl-carrier-protein] reductase FabG [Variovorax sp. WDL1]
MRLKGKVAVVTGAGSGMGRAISLAFVHQGAKVVVADINLEGAAQTAALVEAQDGEAIAVKVDVTRKAETLQMAEAALARFGRIDVLVNNAGSRCLKGFLDHTEDDWHRMIDINLTGHFFCAQAVIPSMLKTGKGKIINLASIAAHTGRPDRVAYCAAKAGVMGLTRALAMDMRGKNICVTAISPGSIATPMNEAAATSTEVAWGKETVVGRWGTADDIAHAAVFLASDESDYITGSEIAVEGGWLIGRARDGEI